MAGDECVGIERHGPVCQLTLDRPRSLNALDGDILASLAHRLDEVRESDARALVLTGEGRAFAAGADIEAMSHMNPSEAAAFSRLGHTTLLSLESLGIPTIAAVNGFALGGGCELACACDWIFASTRARFGQPEVELGLIPGFGGTSRLLRRVGAAWAKQLILTGEPIACDEAVRIGLVNRAFEPEALLPAALEAAQASARCGPQAVAAAKRVLQEGQDADVRMAHALEEHAFGLIFATSDRDEGIRAFLEKRSPVFKGC